MRAIHARIIFLTCAILCFVGVILIFTVLVPFVKSLNRTTDEILTDLDVTPVTIDEIYERDCGIQTSYAITGYIVNNPVVTKTADECRTLCQQYNDTDAQTYAQCDYFSFHNPTILASSLAELDPIIVDPGDNIPKCHFISAMSAIEVHHIEGASSGTTDCIFSSNCLQKMKGVVRTGDQVIERVYSPAECELLCREASPLECLYWTFYASGSISTSDTNILDTCVLHRATKPSSSSIDGSDTWPVQIMRAELGKSLLSSRVCPTSLELLVIQNKVYELYGMDPPNVINPATSNNGNSKFQPTQEQLELWFYENNEFDGGPFPIDPEPDPIGPTSSQNSTCPYGLSIWYRDDALFKLFGSDWGTSLKKDTSVILTPDPYGQGHITNPYGGNEAIEDMTIQDVNKVAIDLSRYDALWVISLKHVPIGCGVSRTITLRSGGVESVINVMEGSNFDDHYTMGLQTINHCDMSLPYLMGDLWHPFLKPDQRGSFSRYTTSDSGTREQWNCQDECTVESRVYRNGVPEALFGAGGVAFNTRGGGVIVIQVDRSRSVKMWNFSPEEIPYDLSINAPNPDKWHLEPTRTISGEEKYLPPMAWFPFMRGCDSQQGCDAEDVLQCPHLLDVCPAYMKDLHKKTVFSVSAAGQDNYTETIVAGYNPVGCHGFQNFENLSIEFGLNFCDEKSTTGWMKDSICSVVSPLPTTGDAVTACQDAQNEDWKTILMDAYWDIYEVRLYESGSSGCYHENYLRVPSV